MHAELLHVADRDCLSRALALLKSGAPIIIPTETIFGLTCDAENEEAIRNLFRIKGRSEIKPSAVFLPDIATIQTVANVKSENAARVISHFLPGPLTVVLSSKRRSWFGVIGEERKIGIRISTDPFVRELTNRYGKPIIATSANFSEKPNCRDLDELSEQFENNASLIIYREKSVTASATTVVDLTGSYPALLREGTMSLEEIQKIWNGSESL